jgi:single-strand DNA-binding protein
MSYHKIIIVGNVGRDPEMRFTPQGDPVTSFNVATNRQYQNKNGERMVETLWFRVSAWGKQAEVCRQYIHKGSKVLVEGRLTGDENGGPRVFAKKDGTAAASFELHAETVRFLSSREGAQGERPMENPDYGAAATDDDIPF